MSVSGTRSAVKGGPLVACLVPHVPARFDELVPSRWMRTDALIGRLQLVHK